MFGIGSSELLVIILVALLVLGPKRLPEVLKIVGRLMAEIKKTAEEVKKEIGADAEMNDIRESLREISDVPLLVQRQMEKEIEELKRLEAGPEEKPEEKSGEAMEETPETKPTAAAEGIPEEAKPDGGPGREEEN